jgi:hypothetical protein
MSFTQADVLAAFDHFERNWGEVQQSEHAACTFCLAEFSPDDVKELYRFEEGIAYEQPLASATTNDTAKCPKCSLPYVIGDGAGLPVIAPGYLAAVQQYWHRSNAQD